MVRNCGAGLTSLESILEYTESAGFFSAATCPEIQMANPHAYWSVYADHPLAKLGRLVSLLPASTADIERVWSMAGSIAAGREALRPEYLN